MTPRAGTHAALLYDGAADFAERLAPLIRRGAARGEHIVVAVQPENAAALAAALGAAAASVAFASREHWYATAAGAIARTLTVTEEALAAGARRVRIIGEPLARATGAYTAQRLGAAEAALGLLIETLPLAMTCAYDRGCAALDDARPGATHPLVLERDGVRRNDAYDDRRARLALLQARLAPAPPGRAHDFDRASLPAVRGEVRTAALAAGVAPGAVDDLVAAAAEAAAHATAQGREAGTLRTWISGDEFVCEIGGAAGALGRGAWLMRRLCTWVELRSEGTQSVVRLHQRRRP